MIEKIDGIVLTELKYGETSKIINIITKEHGLVGIHAKGANSLKSRLRTPASKLIHGAYTIKYNNEKLSNLRDATIINDYKNIKKDIIKIGYSNFLLDLINQVAKEGEPDYLFDLLEQSLNKIDNNLNPEIITQIVMLKCLNNLGIAPHLDSCVECGNTTDIATISSSKGGYLCNSCLDEEVFVSEKTIKLIRMFYLIDISKIDKLDINNQLVEEINRFLDDYYQRYSGIYLKSKEFLKLLKK